MQGHSRGEKFDAKLQSHIKKPNGWTTFLCIFGSAYDYRSIVEGCLIAEESAVKREDKRTAVDALNIMMLTPRFTENEPRMIPYRMKWRKCKEYTILIRFGNCSGQKIAILSIK